MIQKYMDFEPEKVVLLDDYLLIQAKSKQAAAAPPPNRLEKLADLKDSLYSKRSLLIYKLADRSKPNFLNFAHTEEFYC